MAWRHVGSELSPGGRREIGGVVLEKAGRPDGQCVGRRGRGPGAVRGACNDIRVERNNMGKSVVSPRAYSLVPAAAVWSASYRSDTSDHKHRCAPTALEHLPPVVVHVTLKIFWCISYVNAVSNAYKSTEFVFIRVFHLYAGTLSL